MHLCHRPEFIAAWENIDELCLELHLKLDAFAWARDLVLHTTCLRKLSLVFMFDDRTFDGRSISFIDSLVSPPILFPELQELNLRSLHVTASMLSSLLLLCRSSLHKLSLWNIYIHSGAWVPILTDLKTFQFLEDIAIIWPMEHRNGHVYHLVFPALEKTAVVPSSEGRMFKLQYKKWSGKRRVAAASFQGRVGMEKALEMMIECVDYFV